MITLILTNILLGLIILFSFIFKKFFISRLNWKFALKLLLIGGFFIIFTMTAAGILLFVDSFGSSAEKSVVFSFAIIFPAISLAFYPLIPSFFVSVFLDKIFKNHELAFWVFISLMGASLFSSIFPSHQRYSAGPYLADQRQLSSFPAGFLIPAKNSIPEGLKEADSKYYQHYYKKTYMDGTKMLSISEDSDFLCPSRTTASSYVFNQNKLKVYSFSYNGVTGFIVAYSLNTGDFCNLYFNDKDKCLTINYGPVVQGKDPSRYGIDVLKTLVRS